MQWDVEHGALAVLALVDSSNDKELRFQGAELIAGMAHDLHMLRVIAEIVFKKR